MTLSPAASSTGQIRALGFFRSYAFLWAGIVALFFKKGVEIIFVVERSRVISTVLALQHVCIDKAWSEIRQDIKGM